MMTITTTIAIRLVHAELVRRELEQIAQTPGAAEELAEHLTREPEGRAALNAGRGCRANVAGKITFHPSPIPFAPYDPRRVDERGVHRDRTLHRVQQIGNTASRITSAIFDSLPRPSPRNEQRGERDLGRGVQHTTGTARP